MKRRSSFVVRPWSAVLSLIALGLALLAGPSTASAACSTTSTALCVQGSRFRVEVSWSGFAGDGGAGRVVAQQTADSGLFYFYGADNWEILVKVLNACGSGGNSRYWVFAASATTLQYTLTVTDTQTGAVKTYFNPLGHPAAAITDTEAFATCGTPPPPPPPPTGAQVRYLNNLVCNGAGFSSTLSASGFSWTSFSGTPTPYQTVDRTSFGPFIESNTSPCPNATYPGTFAISAGQQYALVQTLQNGSRILGIIAEGPAQTAGAEVDAQGEDGEADAPPLDESAIDDALSAEELEK